MSEQTPEPIASPQAADRPRGGIDFSQYSTEQLIGLRATFDAARFPLENSALEQELARREPSLLAAAQAPPPARFDVRFTARDGFRGWLEALSSRNPLFGAGAAELQVDSVLLSGWSRTWLGVRHAVQLAFPLAAITNVAAPGADAVIEIEYGKAAGQSAEPVRAIYYRGTQDHAPPELPFIDGLSGEQLYDRFGSAEWSAVPDGDAEFEMFPTGITAYLWHRVVKRYGIQSYYQDP
jgi:hypothetical protein